MRDPVVRVVLTHRLHVAAALLVVLTAAGCERPPTNRGGVHSPAQSALADAKPAAEAPPAARATRTATDADPAATSAPATETPRKYLAYYFHRTLRCATCLSIEQQSREAIELFYNDELRAGTFEWHAVNIEAPGNEHFEQDFELQTQSLVLVERTGQRVTRWKLLPQVWELVEDRSGFQEYVVGEVALFIGGG